MRLIFVGLALFCSLGAAVINPRTYSKAQSQPATPAVTVLPTEPTTVSPDATTIDDDTNSTMSVLQVTDYHYFDWPKIGYEIFMEKMIDALKTLKLFMSLDPMLLTITRTYILTNDTDTDYDDNNNSTEVNSNEISSTEADMSLETNTESPLMIQIYDDSDNSEIQNSTSVNDQSKENHSENLKQDDVKKSKAETGGFFSSIAGAVASFYHTLTGWF